jgi:glyoxylase-like metal-dependent hydrolase (beta-lactamase superfamily II)
MAEEIHLINLGFVNAYLLQAGDGFILVDTGIAQQWDRLEKELLKSGCLPSKLKIVVITHGDFDHTGNCAKLQKKYQARIAMHEADADMVKSGRPLKRQTRGLMAKLFQVVGKLTGRRGGFETFQPDVLLKDGQSLSEYGLAAQIIHTPGHTKGSIAILTETGHLVIGDTLSNRTRPDIAPFIQDMQELRESVAKLKRLKATVIYPGHGKPFPVSALSSIEVR